MAEEEADPKFMPHLDVVGNLDGTLAWYTDISELEDEDLWKFVLSTLSSAERQKVLQFYQKADQKRSLLSILMQRCAIR